MKRELLALILVFSFSAVAVAKGPYWQQRADYEMKIDFDDAAHQYSGWQKITYRNNSPDTLHNLYYHLYLNAFQPGSMMDVRSRTIKDADPRVGDHISALSEDEIGYLEVQSLDMNGNALKYKVSGTILIVELDKPILPGRKVKLEMNFRGQVPLQIRRTGRDNSEGIAYSMTQWYPKLAEYDAMGWHADEYVGREFYGVWGNYDVQINIDSAYTVAASGVLQNPREIGHGYSTEGKSLKRPAGDRLTWRFVANDVHDFAWAADKDYIHTQLKMENGPNLHFFYKNEEDLLDNWEKLPEFTEKIFKYASKHFGKYPYPTYSVIQGGDGGMEYAMATLITGRRTLSSLVGVTVHEVMHSWYQMVLATNETMFPWMDEGFTSYASSRIMSHLFNPEEDTRTGRYYNTYINLATSGAEEPMSTYADLFLTNYAYGAAAYGKGAVFPAQLGYVIGQDNLDRGLLRYFDEWQFKHPTPSDFMLVMEQQSGLQLDWYLHYMVNTTNTIDYSLKNVDGRSDGTTITLERIGDFPMPIDLDIFLRDGTHKQINIPMRMMRGSKPSEGEDVDYTVMPDWQWTNATYELSLDIPIDKIEAIEIDASGRLADIDRSNNRVELGPHTEIIINN